MKHGTCVKLKGYGTVVEYPILTQRNPSDIRLNRISESSYYSFKLYNFLYFEHCLEFSSVPSYGRVWGSCHARQIWIRPARRKLIYSYISQHFIFKSYIHTKRSSYGVTLFYGSSFIYEMTHFSATWYLYLQRPRIEVKECRWVLCPIRSSVLDEAFHRNIHVGHDLDCQSDAWFAVDPDQ